MDVGEHNYGIEFLDDYYEPPANRDLHLDWVSVENLASNNTFVLNPLPPERKGILTSAGILSLLARPIDTSPTQRGLFIRERLVCSEIPPPPGVSFDGALALVDLLVSDVRVQDCVVKQVYRHAFAQHESLNQLASIYSISGKWADSGRQLKNLVRQIAVSQPFCSGGTPR